MSTAAITHVAAKLTKTIAKGLVVDPVGTITIATCIAVPAALIYLLTKK